MEYSDLEQSNSTAWFGDLCGMRQSDLEQSKSNDSADSC